MLRCYIGLQAQLPTHPQATLQTLPLARNYSAKLQERLEGLAPPALPALTRPGVVWGQRGPWPPMGAQPRAVLVAWEASQAWALAAEGLWGLQPAWGRAPRAAWGPLQGWAQAEAWGRLGVLAQGALRGEQALVWEA